MTDWWDSPTDQTVEAEERAAIQSEAPVTPGSEAAHRRQVDGLLKGCGTPLWTFQPEAPERGTVCLCSDEQHRAAVQRRADQEGRRVETWTLAEVAAVLDAHSIVAKVKQTWPGAEVTAARSTLPPVGRVPSDQIPFGHWGAGEPPDQTMQEDA